MGKKPTLSLCLRKSTAIFLSFSLTLLNSLSYAQAPAGEAVSRFPLVAEAPSQTLPKDLTQLSLPAGLGAIQEIYQGNSDKTIIYLEDAHTLYEAQKSIQALIDYFQKTYGFNVIALEGGKGKLDPFLFRTYPDPKTLKQVFENYLKGGELSGAVAASVLNEKEADYYGIEDKDLFEEGVLTFLQAQRLKPKLLRMIMRSQAELDGEKEKIYPAKLLEFDRMLNDFQNRNLDLASLLEKLQAFKGPAGFPHLEALMKEMKEDERTDEKAIQNEIEKLADKLRPLVRDKSEVMDFNGRYQTYRTSQESPKAFAHYLLERSRALGGDDEEFTALRKAVENFPLLMQMQAPVFSGELEAYIQSIKADFVTNEKVRQLDERERRLFLLRRLIRLELTYKEWEEVKANSVERRADSKTLNVFWNFYEIAQKREQALFENLKRLSNEKKASQIIFLSGGFHTSGITEMLQKNNISYVLISPRMAEVPEESPYQRIMRGDVSWKNYFRVRGGRVNLFDAFARGTVNRLFGVVRNESWGMREDKASSSRLTPQDPRHVLKTWRDEIIQQLAGREQISQAGEYTRFIDEAALGTIAESERAPLEAKLRARIDQFLTGLKSLVNQNRLTEENLFRLFKTPASMPAANIASLIPGFEIRKEAVGLGESNLSGYVSSGGPESQVGMQFQKRRESPPQLQEASEPRYSNSLPFSLLGVGGSLGQANHAKMNSNIKEAAKTIFTRSGAARESHPVTNNEVVNSPVKWNNALDTASLRYGLKRSRMTNPSLMRPSTNVNKNNKIYDEELNKKPTSHAEVRKKEAYSVERIADGEKQREPGLSAQRYPLSAISYPPFAISHSPIQRAEVRVAEGRKLSDRLERNRFSGVGKGNIKTSEEVFTSQQIKPYSQVGRETDRGLKGTAADFHRQPMQINGDGASVSHHRKDLPAFHEIQSDSLGLKDRKEGDRGPRIDISFGFKPVLSTIESQPDNRAGILPVGLIGKDDRPRHILSRIAKRMEWKSWGWGTGMPIVWPYLFLSLVSSSRILWPGLTGNIRRPATRIYGHLPPYFSTISSKWFLIQVSLSNAFAFIESKFNTASQGGQFNPTPSSRAEVRKKEAYSRWRIADSRWRIADSIGEETKDHLPFAIRHLLSAISYPLSAMSHPPIQRAEVRSEGEEETANPYADLLKQKSALYADLLDHYQKAKQGDLHSFAQLIQRLHIDWLRAEKEEAAADRKRQEKLRMLTAYLFELASVPALRKALEGEPSYKDKLFDLLIHLYREDSFYHGDKAFAASRRLEILKTLSLFEDERVLGFITEEMEMLMMGKGRALEGGIIGYAEILRRMGERAPLPLLYVRNRVAELLERRRNPGAWDFEKRQTPKRRDSGDSLRDIVRDTVEGHLVEYAKVLFIIDPKDRYGFFSPLLIRMTAREMPWWLRDQAIYQLSQRRDWRSAGLSQILRENYLQPGRFPDDLSFVRNLIQEFKNDSDDPWRTEPTLEALDAFALLGARDPFQGEDRAFLFRKLREALKSQGAPPFENLVPQIAEPENQDELLRWIHSPGEALQKSGAAGLAARAGRLEEPALKTLRVFLLTHLLDPETKERDWILRALVSLSKHGKLSGDENPELRRQAARWIFEEARPWHRDEIERLEIIRDLNPSFAEAYYRQGSWKQRASVLEAVKTSPAFRHPDWDLRAELEERMVPELERLFTTFDTGRKDFNEKNDAEDTLYLALQLTEAKDGPVSASKGEFLKRAEQAAGLAFDLEHEISRLFNENPNRNPQEIYGRAKERVLQGIEALSRIQRIHFRLGLLRLLRDLSTIREIRRRAFELGLLHHEPDLEFTDRGRSFERAEDSEARDFLRQMIGFLPSSFHVSFTPTSFHVSLDAASFERLYHFSKYGLDWGIESLSVREMRLTMGLERTPWGYGGVYYSSLGFRFLGDENIGIRSFQHAASPAAEKTSEWIFDHEEAHLRFARFGSQELLSQRMQLGWRALAPLVDSLEKFLLEKGVKDPDLRFRLFRLTAGEMLSFHDEIRSRYADERLIVPGYDFERWFDFYFSNYQKDEFSRHMLNRIHDAGMLAEFWERFKREGLHARVQNAAGSIYAVYRKKLSGLKSPTEEDFRTLRGWTALYALLAPVSYPRVFKLAASESSSMFPRSEARAVRKELYDFERWRMNEILTEAKAIQDQYGPRVPGDTEEKQALTMELVKRGEEMDDLLMNGLFPPEALDEETNHFIEVMDRFYIKQNAISQNLLRRFFHLDLESLLKKFPESYPETQPESEDVLEPLARGTKPPQKTVKPLPAPRTHELNPFEERILRSFLELENGGEPPILARDFHRNYIRKGHEKDTEKKLDELARLGHLEKSPTPSQGSVYRLSEMGRRTAQSRSEARLEEQNKIQAMNQRLTILDQAAGQVIREAGVDRMKNVLPSMAILPRGGMQENTVSRAEVRSEEASQEKMTKGVFYLLNGEVRFDFELHPQGKALIFINGVLRLIDELQKGETIRFGRIFNLQPELKGKNDIPVPAEFPEEIFGAISRMQLQIRYRGEGRHWVFENSEGKAFVYRGQIYSSPSRRLLPLFSVGETRKLWLEGIRRFESLVAQYLGRGTLLDNLEINPLGSAENLVSLYKRLLTLQFFLNSDDLEHLPPDFQNEVRNVRLRFEALKKSIEEHLRTMTDRVQAPHEEDFTKTVEPLPPLEPLPPSLKIRESFWTFPRIALAAIAGLALAAGSYFAIRWAVNKPAKPDLQVPQQKIAAPVSIALRQDFSRSEIRKADLNAGVSGSIVQREKQLERQALTLKELSTATLSNQASFSLTRGYNRILAVAREKIKTTLTAYETAPQGRAGPRFRFEALKENLKTVLTEARVKTKDFSKLRRDFQQLEDRERLPEFQTTSGNGDQPGLPRHFGFPGFSSLEGKDAAGLGQGDGFVYRLSSEWLRGAFGDIAGNFRRQRPSQTQGFQETFNRPVAQDAFRLLIAGSGTFHFLPVSRPKPGLVQVNHRLSLQEKGKAQDLFHFARRELFQDPRYRLGNLDGFSFHNKINSSTLLMPRQSIPISRSEARSEVRSEGEWRGEDQLQNLKRKVEAMLNGLELKGGYYFVYQPGDQSFAIQEKKEGGDEVVGKINPLNFRFKGEAPAVETGYSIFQPALHQNRGIVSGFLEALGRELPENVIYIQTILNPPTLEKIAKDLLEKKGRFPDEDWERISRTLRNFEEAIGLGKKEYVDLPEYSELIPGSRVSGLQLELSLQLGEAYQSNPELIPAPDVLWQTKLGRLARHYGKGDIRLEVNPFGFLELISSKPISSGQTKTSEEKNQQDQSGRRSEVRVDNQTREKLLKIEAAYRDLLQAIEKELPEQVQEIPGYGQFYPTHFIVIPEIVDFLGKRAAEKDGSFSLLDFGGGNAHTAFRLAAAGEKIKVTSVEKNPFLAALAETVRFGVNENSLAKLSASYEILKGKTETEKVKGKIEAEIIPKLQTLNEVLRKTGILNRVEPVEGDGFKIDLKKFQAVYLNFPTLREAEGEAFQQEFAKKIAAELPSGAFVILFRHPFPAVDHLIGNLESRGFKRITEDFFTMDFPVLIFQKPMVPEVRMVPFTEAFGTFERPEISVAYGKAYDFASNEMAERASGLKESYRILTSEGRRIFIADDHHKVFPFWLEAYRDGLLSKGSALLHIDAHPDDAASGRAVQGLIDLDTLSETSPEEVEKKVMDYYGIDSFIVPAVVTGLIDSKKWFYLAEIDDHVFQEELVWKRSPWQGISPDSAGPFQFTYGLRRLPLAEVLKDKGVDLVDLDVDWFEGKYNRLTAAFRQAGRSETEARELARRSILQDWAPRLVPLLARGKVVSIATSPGFIDQEFAAQIVRTLLEGLQGFDKSRPEFQPFQLELQPIDRLEEEKRKATETLRKIPREIWENIPASSFEEAESMAREHFDKNPLPENRPEFQPLVNFAARLNPRALVYRKLERLYLEGEDRKVSPKALLTLLGLFKNDSSLPPAERLPLYEFVASFRYRIPALLDSLSGTSSRAEARSEVRTELGTIERILEGSKPVEELIRLELERINEMQALPLFRSIAEDLSSLFEGTTEGALMQMIQEKTLGAGHSGREKIDFSPVVNAVLFRWHFDQAGLATSAINQARQWIGSEFPGLTPQVHKEFEFIPGPPQDGSYQISLKFPAQDNRKSSEKFLQIKLNYQPARGFTAEIYLQQIQRPKEGKENSSSERLGQVKSKQPEGFMKGTRALLEALKSNPQFQKVKNSFPLRSEARHVPRTPAVQSHWDSARSEVRAEEGGEGDIDHYAVLVAITLGTANAYLNLWKARLSGKSGKELKKLIDTVNQIRNAHFFDLRHPLKLTREEVQSSLAQTQAVTARLIQLSNKLSSVQVGRWVIAEPWLVSVVRWIKKIMRGIGIPLEKIPIEEYQSFESESAQDDLASAMVYMERVLEKLPPDSGPARAEVRVKEAYSVERRADSKWPIADSEWHIADSKWRIADGETRREPELSAIRHKSYAMNHPPSAISHSPIPRAEVRAEKREALGEGDGTSGIGRDGKIGVDLAKLGQGDAAAYVQNLKAEHPAIFSDVHHNAVANPQRFFHPSRLKLNVEGIRLPVKFDFHRRSTPLSQPIGRDENHPIGLFSVDHLHHPTMEGLLRQITAPEAGLSMIRIGDRLLDLAGRKFPLANSPPDMPSVIKMHRLYDNKLNTIVKDFISSRAEARKKEAYSRWRIADGEKQRASELSAQRYPLSAISHPPSASPRAEVRSEAAAVKKAVEEISAGLQREDFYDKQEPFIVSNEEGWPEILARLEKLTRPAALGFHIGVSGLANYDILAARKTSIALLIDTNANMQKVHEIVKEQTLKAQSPEELQKALIQIFNRPEFSLEQEDRIWLRGMKWLNDQDAFEFIRKMFLEERILILQMSFLDEAALSKIVEWIRSSSVPLDTVYISNILSGLAPERKIEFRNALERLTVAGEYGDYSVLASHPGRSTSVPALPLEVVLYDARHILDGGRDLLRSEVRVEKAKRIVDVTPIYRAAGRVVSSEEELERIVERPLREAAKIFLRKRIVTTYTSANRNDFGRDRLGDGKTYAVVGFQPAAFSESNFKIYETISSRVSPWKYGEIKTAAEHGGHFLLFPITEETTVQELNEKAVEAADQFGPQGEGGKPYGREAFYELLKLLHQNGWLIESGHYELTGEWGAYHDLTAFDFLQGSVNRNAVFHWDEAMFGEKKKFAQEIISHRMAAGMLDTLRKNHSEDEPRLYALVDELGILIDTMQAKAWHRTFQSEREHKKTEQLRNALPKVQALVHERYRVHAIYFGYSAHDQEVRNLVQRVASQSVYGGTRLALQLLPHELVYNMLSHGKGGALGVKVLEEAGNKILEIVAWDSGPGILDPEKIRQRSVEARGTRRGQAFRYFTQVPGEVIIESLGKRWEKTAEGNFQLLGPSEIFAGDGTRITVRIPKRSEVRSSTEMSKNQPNYRDSFLRVMRELQETKKASPDQVRAIKNLVRWQEEAQETGRRIEGRYDAPLEIIVGHLEKPLYPDYENQITEFFINLPDKTVSRLVDRLMIVTTPGKAEKSYQLFLDTARKALEEKPSFFDLIHWRLQRLDRTHYLGDRQLDSIVQERVRRAITDIREMKESLPARAEVRSKEAYGVERMADSRWRIADSVWRIADSKWRIADGETRREPELSAQRYPLYASPRAEVRAGKEISERASSGGQLDKKELSPLLSLQGTSTRFQPFSSSSLGRRLGLNAQANAKSSTTAAREATFKGLGKGAKKTDANKAPQEISDIRNKDLATRSRRYVSNMGRRLTEAPFPVKTKVHNKYDINSLFLVPRAEVRSKEAYGVERMADSRWRIADSVWRIADSKWRIADGETRREPELSAQRYPLYASPRAEVRSASPEGLRRTEVQIVAKKTTQILLGKSELSMDLISDLKHVVGTDGFALFEGELRKAADRTIPQIVLERVMGIRNVFANETMQEIPLAWQENFAKSRIPQTSITDNRNFVIYTGSVSPESLVHFVKDTFPRLGKGSRLTVVYEKENDAQKIRAALKQTIFWSQIRFRRAARDLTSTLANAYEEFGKEGAVVVAPSIQNFPTLVAAHHRLVLGHELMERGVPLLAEDVLNQIGVPLAGIPALLKPEEIQHQIDQLMIQWSQQGFRGVQFRNGIIPNLKLYLEFITAQFRAESRVRASA